MDCIYKNALHKHSWFSRVAPSLFRIWACMASRIFQLSLTLLKPAFWLWVAQKRDFCLQTMKKGEKGHQFAITPHPHKYR